LVAHEVGAQLRFKDEKGQAHKYRNESEYGAQHPYLKSFHRYARQEKNTQDDTHSTQDTQDGKNASNLEHGVAEELPLAFRKSRTLAIGPIQFRITVPVFGARNQPAEETSADSLQYGVTIGRGIIVKVAEISSVGCVIDVKHSAGGHSIHGCGQGTDGRHSYARDGPTAVRIRTGE